MMQIEGLDAMVGSDLIQDIFLFRQLNFDETLSLSSLLVQTEKKAGDVIIEEGELGRALYIVEHGEVVVFKGEGKHRRELARLGPGELFGEMSLIENDLTSASVAAKTNVKLLVINREDFEKLIGRDLNIALKVYKTFCNTLSERLRKTSEELSQLKEEGVVRPGKEAKPADATQRQASPPAPAKVAAKPKAPAQAKCPPAGKRGRGKK